MCTCELSVTSMINIRIMFKSTKILETVRLEVYPVEGPMLKAPVAPHALIDIVRCSMSRPQSMQDDPRKKNKMSAVTRKKRAVAETLPKNLIARTPEQVSLCRRWFRRPALLTLRACRGLGWGNSGVTQQKNNGAGCVVSRTRS
jgi:hypothetical protein